MASRETYCIVNRPLENDPTRRQFVQVRGVVDPQMAGEVHGLPLVAGEWFSDAGVRTPAGARPRRRDQIEAVVGAGRGPRTRQAPRQGRTLGWATRSRLGDRDWVVAGVMNSDGTTFGSEVWAKQAIRLEDVQQGRLHVAGRARRGRRRADDGRRRDGRSPTT